VTLLALTESPSKGIRIKRMLQLRCNNCALEFGRVYTKRDVEREVHACSKSCADEMQRNGGAIDAIKQMTSLKNYGTPWPFQTAHMIEKRRQTMLERYGVEHPLQSELLYEKRTKTMLERYGVKHALQKPDLDLAAVGRKSHLTKKRNGSYAR